MTNQITENFELILEGDQKALNQIRALFESGELTKILGVPVLEVLEIDASTALTSNWFKKIEVSDWLYDIGIQASRLVQRLIPNDNMAVAVLRGDPVAIGNNNQLDKIVSKIPAEWLSEISLDSSENTSDRILISLLNGSNLDPIKFIAYELGDLTNVPAEIIDTLATCITTIEESETHWQLALTLGKLDSEHPLGAVGQRKKIQLAGNRLELFLALRVGEDDLIDVLLQVYHARKDYLPVGLQLSLLDETEKIFSEVIAKEEERYLSLEFTRAIGQFFSVKLSLGGNDLIENFVI